MKSMRRGARVLVEGRLVYGEVIDARGTPHTTSSIVAGEILDKEVPENLIMRD